MNYLVLLKITAFGSIILDRTFGGTGEALGASLNASGTSTQTGIIGVTVVNPGYGYLSSPNGATGGDGTNMGRTRYKLL